MKTSLFRFPAATRRDPDVALWLKRPPGELGAIARRWFEMVRGCGDDVREILHDGHPTACVTDAAFAYVDDFKDHVNLGFFHGAALPDPQHLLEGTGKAMRHVKLGPSRDLDARALENLIAAAYADIQARVRAESAWYVPESGD